MSASEPMKPASPHVVVGLSCRLAGGAGTKELVERHFSSLTVASQENSVVDQLDSETSRVIIELVDSAISDTRNVHILRNTAVFLSLSKQYANSDIARELREHFRSKIGADLTVMVTNETRQALSEALSWLDRGECEFAMVAACDSINHKTLAAAVVIANAGAAMRSGINPYAILTRETHFSRHARAISLVEVSAAAWQESNTPALRWQLIRTNEIRESLDRECTQPGSANEVPESLDKEQTQPGSAREVPESLDNEHTQPGSASEVPESLDKERIQPGSANVGSESPSRRETLDQEWRQHDSCCYVSSLALELSLQSERLSPVFSLINAALALQLRVIPGQAQSQLKLEGTSDLILCKNPRPWVHPVSPVEPAHPRRCLLILEQESYLLSEYGEDVTTVQLRSLQQQSSELFIFSGSGIEELKENIISRGRDIASQQWSPFAELASRQNRGVASDEKYRLAIVANKHAQLVDLLNEALAHLESSPDKALTQIGGMGNGDARPMISKPTGIFYTGKPSEKPGKMVFIFPGLGAAYPQMLADLCFYFPEVRQVFDFVERMALRASDKVIPSRAVFPGQLNSSSQATLATMDSSVVTLLLAEWAIFALLKKLGVNADIFLGCSTGEFAALTISDAVNIFESAQIFYSLSTHVSRSISANELNELRSIRVEAQYEEELKPILSRLTETVYVGADLSDSCVLISGQKSAIENLVKVLRVEKIDYLNLPVAIPYHTPLVSGKISQDDVRDLDMRAPKVEAWSCSTGEKYPDDGNMLRRISTDLFEKPILLRSTIKRLHDENARVFVEVGPKGGLVPYISEVLSGKEHVSVATNLAAKSGIDQLNALLAVLVCHGIEMNLAALYERRVADESDSGEDPGPSGGHVDEYNLLSDALEMRRAFDLDAETLNLNASLSDIAGLAQGSFTAEEIIGKLLGQNLDILSGGGLSDDIMLTYLATMQQFHASLMGTQERLLMAYLLGDEELPESESDEMRGSRDYAFLPNVAVQSGEDHFLLEFKLSTAKQLFLLDHAIGGDVSTSEQSSQVSLLPLMVALEIMAEGASLFMQHLRLIRISDVRAYKRIRTDERELTLNLEIRTVKDDSLEARICSPATAEGESSVLASCVLEFGVAFPEAPEPVSYPTQESRESKLSPNNLYGAGSMFHGERMQAVEIIDLVSKRSIEGRISCRYADKWFEGQPPEIAPNLILDPLLLDNASQFVLYQMYEHDLPATALLPFHIASIEFFQGYDKLRGETVFASAFLSAMSLRGTEAKIQLANPDGKLVAKVNDISSRAIVLPEVFRDFVADPSLLLCHRIEFSEILPAVITAISKTDIPADDTALDWLTDYILTDAEQKEWRQVGRTEKRRRDWLLGRIAAKDAVRILYQQELKLKLKPADIEIKQTEAGHAEVRLPKIEVPWVPQISISHCAKVAAAIAELPRTDRQSGIDVEDIEEREEGFTELACTEEELAWLDTKPVSIRAKQIAKLWTTKESAAKSCGSGLAGNPKLFKMSVGESSDTHFKMFADVVEPARAGYYECLVSTEKFSGVSLAVVLKYLPT